MVSILRNRPAFRRLWLGGLVSQLGDWVGWVAVAMAAVQGGGGPLDVALVFALHHLPAAAFAPVAGVVADRVDRRTLLVGTSIGLAVVTLGMAAAAMVGALGLLQALLLLRSAGAAFLTPAERAALPKLVEKDELLPAGALESASWSVMFAFGMAAGGVLSLLGPAWALGLDAATFVLSALFFVGLPRLRPERDGPVTRPQLLREVRAAVRWVWPRPQLRRAVFAKTPFAVAGGAAWIALALQADALGGAMLGGLGFGLLHAARGVGTGVGPVVVAGHVARGGAREHLWRAGYWVGLAGAALLGAVEHPLALAVAAFVWGIGGGTNWVVSTEQMQRLTPDGILARASALDQVGMTLGMTVGVFAVALLVHGGSSLAAAVVSAVLAAALVWWSLDRTSEHALATDAVPQP